jgi:hypothetical protein
MQLVLELVGSIRALRHAHIVDLAPLLWQGRPACTDCAVACRGQHITACVVLQSIWLSHAPDGAQWCMHGDSFGGVAPYRVDRLVGVVLS